jgi:hypothetical protein
MNGVAHLAMALVSAAATPLAGGWHAGPGAQISFGDAERTVYKLDCSGPELVVTQYGVTQLLDLQENKPVGDSDGSTLPAGAAVMALATDKVEPNMIRATAVRNAERGWDMTIRLPKDDPTLRSLPRAEYFSLFTTGFTLAVPLGKADRKLLSAFVEQCRG